MSRRRGSAALVLATLVLALAAGCAPAPKVDGTVLTLPPPSAPTTVAPPELQLSAAIQLRTTGAVRKQVMLTSENVCVDDQRGTLRVRGAAADGTRLEVILVNPAAGNHPVATTPPTSSPAAPRPTSVTDVTLRLAGKEYHRPSAGQVTVADAQARKATVVAQAFAEDPNLKMTADWTCSAQPATSPTPPP